MMLFLVLMLGFLCFGAVIFKWNATFQDEEGDITHSDEGLVILSSPKEKGDIVEYVGNKYARKGDAYYRVRVDVMTMPDGTTGNKAFDARRKSQDEEE